jgi:hypothetical protein
MAYCDDKFWMEPNRFTVDCVETTLARAPHGKYRRKHGRRLKLMFVCHSLAYTVTVRYSGYEDDEGTNATDLVAFPRALHVAASHAKKKLSFYNTHSFASAIQRECK